MLVDSDVADSPMVPRAISRPIVVARAALASLWLVWAALAWWSVPRPASVDQLRDDLAADRIVSYTRAESWEYPRVWAWPTKIQFGAQGGLIIWVTSDGRTRYAAPDFSRDPGELAVSVSGTVIGEDNETTRLARQLDLAGIPHGATNPVTEATLIVAILLLVVGLGILIGGPDPARGTRWFWFWIGQWPFGLGYLAWLALERPWTAPPPREKRQNGWFGFALMIVGSIVISVLAYVANNVLGPGVIPFR